MARGKKATVATSTTGGGAEGEGEVTPKENAEPKEFWGPMQKGNLALCGDNFTWSAVDQVLLHDEVVPCQFSINHLGSISTSFGPPSFVVSGVELPVTESIVENFGHKARELVRLIGHLTEPVQDNYIQMTRPGLDSGGDSDEEIIPDSEIEAAFTDVEWDLIVTTFKSLREMYISAKRNNFENAYGKYFMEDFVKFCCLLDKKKREYVRHGTSSSGEKQPGCCILTRKVVRAYPSRSRSVSVDTIEPSCSKRKCPIPAEETPAPKRKRASTSSPSTSSQSTSTNTRASTRAKKSVMNEAAFTSPAPTSPPKRSICTNIKSYSDFSAWDPYKRLYSLSGEVKSEEKASAEEQSVDQMFRNYQKASLGLILKPETIQINILERNDTDLTLHLYKVLSTTRSSTYKMLCRIVITFLFLVKY